MKFKRLIKSELYNSLNYYNIYIEIFKNPTEKEIIDIKKHDGDVRGLLYKDGTIYAWPSDILHEKIEEKIKGLDFSQYHFFTYGGTWIKFHIDGKLIQYDEIWNVIKISENVLNNILNLKESEIEIANLNARYFEGSYEELENYLDNSEE